MHSTMLTTVFRMISLRKIIALWSRVFEMNGNESIHEILYCLLLLTFDFDSKIQCSTFTVQTKLIQSHAIAINFQLHWKRSFFLLYSSFRLILFGIGMASGIHSSDICDFWNRTIDFTLLFSFDFSLGRFIPHNRIFFNSIVTDEMKATENKQIQWTFHFGC